MTEITIYQNYIADEDRQELDPSFVPNDWRHNPTPELYEIAIFFDLFESGRYKEADYVGAVSKKFFDKTKISGAKFIEFIRNNPGKDVYFINPFPQNAYFSFNVWQNGEIHHKGISSATQLLFDRADIPVKVDELGRNNCDTLLYCNYWVGNARFWEKYISFLKNLFCCITEVMPSEERQIFFNDTLHRAAAAPLFPFIFERLFSTYLLMEPDISYLSYKHSPDQIKNACLSDQERQIYNAFGSLIDKLDKEKNRDDDIRAITTAILSLPTL